MQVTPQSTATPPQPATQPDKADTKTVVNSDFETFLVMMTTQMQNQDPLNPIESADFAVQLATFSGVEQQVQTNKLLSSLGAQLGSMGMSQLAGWVGMEAEAKVPAYFDGDPVPLSPEIKTGADRAVLSVRDDGGSEIQRFEIPLDQEKIQWSGLDNGGAPVSSGTYSFHVESYAGEELLGTQQARVYSEVVEARLDGNAITLVFDGGITVPSTDITALRGSSS